MHRSLLVPLLVAVASAVLATPAAAESPCGASRINPDYRDIRAHRTSCTKARSVVAGWIYSEADSVRDLVRTRGYRCRGRQSVRRLSGRQTFLVDCTKGSKRVRWWIVPYH